LLTDRIHRQRIAALSVGGVLLVVLALLPHWDAQLLYAGLFRTREPLPGTYRGPETFKASNPGRFNAPILFHADDPVASVTVAEFPTPAGGRSLSIATNGKSDGNTFVDYTTMALAGSLPAMLADKPERAFVIGWGTGITAAELASLESMREVQVVEISQAVIDAAPLFDFANQRASSNAKIRVIRSDAYRALMRMNQTYDVIVSEPSNPWMTGVEMLFSKEFLTAARARLSPGGVYAQWIHQYETSNETLELVLRTYSSVFGEVAVWGTVYNDLLLLGFNREGSATDYYRLAERVERPDYKASLQRAGVTNLSALLAHEILPVGVVQALDLQGPIHTLYHPRLNDVAARAFFRGDRGELPFAGYGEPARLGRDKSMLRSHKLLHGGQLPEAERSEYVREACRSIGPRCQAPLAEWRADASDSLLFRATAQWVEATLTSFSHTFQMIVADEERLSEMATLFGSESLSGHDSSKFPTPEYAEQITEEFRQLYHLPTPFSADRLIGIWESCREGETTLEQCRENAEGKRASGSEVDVDTLVEQCLSVKMVGPRCQAGLADARELTEYGRHHQASAAPHPHGRSRPTDYGR
jgi:spermidine synthase